VCRKMSEVFRNVVNDQSILMDYPLSMAAWKGPNYLLISTSAAVLLALQLSFWFSSFFLRRFSEFFNTQFSITIRVSHSLNSLGLIHPLGQLLNEYKLARSLFVFFENFHYFCCDSSKDFTENFHQLLRIFIRHQHFQLTISRSGGTIEYYSTKDQHKLSV
jgi:hypothetical protein